MGRKKQQDILGDWQKRRNTPWEQGGQPFPWMFDSKNSKKLAAVFLTEGCVILVCLFGTLRRDGLEGSWPLPLFLGLYALPVFWIGFRYMGKARKAKRDRRQRHQLRHGKKK